MKHTPICLAIILSLGLAAVWADGPAESEPSSGPVTEGGISYLPPSAFPHLLHTIQKSLQRRGYRIPQTSDNPKPHNVIQGEFLMRGQTDIAVLCSKDGQSWIFVFWGGSTANPAKIAAGVDADYLRPLGEGRSAYTRTISKAGEAAIRAQSGGRVGEESLAVSHDGIQDSRVGGGSVIHYCHLGEWQTLPGGE